MAKAVPAAQVFHDRCNLIALPILGLLALAGCFGWYDAPKVTNMFLCYIAADTVWIWTEPEALPGLPNVILLHHFVTLALLLFPLRHPSFAIYTCLDGITELNTFFMIARRQWVQQRRLMHYCYWATFVPCRLILYPGLLYPFWRVLEGFPLWERLLVVTCQFLLCCFNLVMLYLSLQRRWTSKKQAEKLVDGASAAALKGKKGSATKIGTRMKKIKAVRQALTHASSDKKAM